MPVRIGQDYNRLIIPTRKNAPTEYNLQYKKWLHHSGIISKPVPTYLRKGRLAAPGRIWSTRQPQSGDKGVVDLKRSTRYKTASNSVSQASTGGSVYDLGVQSSATFNISDEGRLTLSYTARDEKRSTSIVLKCDQETRFDRLEFVGEISIARYEMLLSSPCACPGYCDDFGLYEAVAKNMSGYWEHERGPRPPAPVDGAGKHEVPQSPLFPWSDVGTSMVALLFHDIVLIIVIASCVVLVKYFKSTCGRICARTKRYQSGRNGYLTKECDSVESGV